MMGTISFGKKNFFSKVISLMYPSYSFKIDVCTIKTVNLRDVIATCKNYEVIGIDEGQFVSIIYQLLLFFS